MRVVGLSLVCTVMATASLACETVPETLAELIASPEREACLEAMLDPLPEETRARVLGDVLLAAVFDDDAGLVEVVLDAGATTIGEGFAETPLFRAAYVGATATTELLLERGADPDLGADFGDGRREAPLDVAARYGHGGVVDLLIAAGADLGGQAPLSPLVAAVEGGHVDAALALLEAGAPDRRAEGGWDAPLLDMALFTPHDTGPLMAALIAAGHDPHGEDGDLLHRAVDLGRPEAVRVLVAAGVDVNLRAGPQMRTPLEVAVMEQQIAAVPALLSLGAEINLSGLNRTLVFSMLERGEPVMAYLDAEGDPEAQARIYSLAAIELASSGGFGLEDAARMVAEGADLNLLAGADHPLSQIGCAFQPIVGEELIAMGADPTRAFVEPEPDWVVECREHAPDMAPYLEMLGYDG